VIVINSHTQSSYSEAISVSSGDEINMSSDIDIDSDYMMLDETFDDMGDIVINIHDNQKTLLENYHLLINYAIFFKKSNVSLQ
jgi:hypothetical protein